MSTQERITGLEATIAELRAELDEWQSKYANLLTESAEETGSWSYAVGKLEEKNDSLRAELETLREERAVLQSQVENADVNLEQCRLCYKDEITALRAENARLKEERKEIADYLWPNQTGLPNEHRNVLIAVETRERLKEQQNAQLTARIAELEEVLRYLLDESEQNTRRICKANCEEYGTGTDAENLARKALNQPRE